MSSVPKNNWRVSQHDTLCFQAMSLIHSAIGTSCIGLLAVVLLSFAFKEALPAQSPFLRTDRDNDPAYSDAYRHRLRELRERVAQNQQRWEDEQERASQEARARQQEDDDEHRSAWAPGVDDRRSPAGRTEQERASQQEDDDEHRSAWALGEPETALRLEIDTASSSAPQGWSRQRTSTSRRRSPAGQDEQERASQQDDSFAAASGKCGDITTQKIGNFYYHSDGGVTQKVGNFLYGPDGEVTQKIGNFYYHSDGTTTQQIGNFYYDSDGGVTQKIGSFFYHSGGTPSETEGRE